MRADSVSACTTARSPAERVIIRMQWRDLRHARCRTIESPPRALSCPMLSTVLLGGSTLVLLVWGIWDLRTGHKRDGVFLILIGLFDGVAAVASHVDFAHIEAKLAPRTLSLADQDRFGAALAQVPKQRVTILVNADVTSGERDEQYDFADDIERALRRAGWTTTLVRSIFPRRPQPLTGLGVWAASDTDATLIGMGGAFEAIGLRPTIGTLDAAKYVGAPVSDGETGPHIEISVLGRPAP